MKRLLPAVLLALVAALPGCSQPEPTPPEIEPVHLDASNFTPVVLEADKPVLVDFYTTSCGHCRTIEPVVRQLAAYYEGRAVVARIDAEKSEQISKKYQVDAYPTFLLFKDGREVNRVKGAPRKQTLEALIESQLAG